MTLTLLLVLMLACNGGKPTPEPVCAPGNWKDVSVGPSMACGVHEDGCIECWGNEGMEEDYGVQGYAMYEATGDDVPPTGVLFSTVAVYPGDIPENAGGYESCGVSQDYELYCWGNNRLVYPSSGLRAVVVDNVGHVGLRADGTLFDYDYNATGVPDLEPPVGRYLDADGAIGPFSCAIDTDGVASCWGDCTGYEAECAVPDEQFIMMDLGYGGGCGVLQSGELRCWAPTIGYDDSPAPDLRFQTIVFDVLTGILDDGTLWSGDSRLSDVPAGTYSVVSGAYGHACAISTDGELVCWGRDVGNVTSPPP